MTKCWHASANRHGGLRRGCAVVGVGQHSFRLSGSYNAGTIGIYEDYRNGRSIITNAREFHILNSMNAFSYVYRISKGGNASEIAASSAELFSGLFDWFKERVG